MSSEHDSIAGLIAYTAEKARGATRNAPVCLDKLSPEERERIGREALAFMVSCWDYINDAFEERHGNR